MENYYNSYPESGGSSPRSREIDFENPTPWEEQQQPNNYKVKFMCSYGGKIHPRPHDNQLSYVGGETKILAVDRTIKFSALVAKLSALCDADVSFKYQLPGEDLDALISVTNDDDLEHMMHEYDRLYRASAKPARLRLFLFAVNPPPVTPSRSIDSTDGKLDRERFVESLNSGPILSAPPPATNVDLLFALDKDIPPAMAAAKVRDPITDSAIREQEVPIHGVEDRVIAPDPIQKHIQDLQRLRIGEEQAMYRRKSDESLAAAFSGDYYVQKTPEKLAPTTIQGTMPISAGYWPEKQIAGGVYPGNTLATDQPVYMIPASAGVYHTPIGRPMTGPAGQGYYAMQRMPPEVYRDQPVYNVVPPAKPAAAPPPTLPLQPPPKAAGYSEGFGMMRPATTGGAGVVDTGYAQMAYDSAVGRQVYYTAAGGVVPQPQPQPPPPPPQYQAMAAPAYSADMRPAGNFNQEGGKVVPAKVSRA